VTSPIINQLESEVVVMKLFRHILTKVGSISPTRAHPSTPHLYNVHCSHFKVMQWFHPAMGTSPIRYIFPKHTLTLSSLLFLQRTSSILQNGLGILIELLRKRRQTVYDATSKAADLPPLIRVMSGHLGELHTLLTTVDETVSVSMPFGLLQPPLGLQRQSVMELIEALALTNSSVVFDALLASPVLQTAIALFFRYVWNSFLHQSVYSVVAVIMQSPHTAVKAHLLDTCRLLDLTIEVEAQNKVEFEATNVSRGYIGHLTKMSALINAAAADADAEHPGDPAVKALLDARPQWQEYTADTLAQRSALEAQLLGGARPTAPATLDDGEQGADSSAQLSSMMYRIGGVSGMFEQQETEETPDDGEIGATAFDPSEFESRAPFPTDERQFGFDTAYEEEDGSSSSDSEGEDDETPEDDGDTLIHTGGVDVEQAGSSDGSGSPTSPLSSPTKDPSTASVAAPTPVQPSASDIAKEEAAKEAPMRYDAVADTAAKDDAPLPVPPIQAPPTETLQPELAQLQPETVQPEPVQPQPVQPEPIEPETIQPEPTQPEAAKPEPIPAEAAPAITASTASVPEQAPALVVETVSTPTVPVAPVPEPTSQPTLEPVAQPTPEQVSVPQP
jgi:hypothetical protein